MSGSGWTCNTETCTRTDAWPALTDYPAITVTVNVANNAAAGVTNSVTVSGGGELDVSDNIANDPTTISQLADLMIAKTHSGTLRQGQTGAHYTLTVTNSGSGATSGLVTVTDMLPAALTATALAGDGWTCTLGTVSCTRGDVLAAGQAYPPITLTVDLSANAPANITNTATVSGGGQIITTNDTASDVAAVTQVADLAIAKTHSGNFRQGQPGAQYTITVSNTGPGPTVGEVTVTDTLPAGLTATTLGGTGWTCTPGTLTCTRTDVLASGASYPAITLTVSVANNSSASVTNSVAVSGGGELNTSNNTASDVTTVEQVADLVVAKSHVGNFTQGQTGAQYTITVNNTGPGPTVGTVTVADSLPAALTATGLHGSGWGCVLGTLTCTRSDVLAGGGSYPPITLTVTVAHDAAADLTNNVSVNGGGELNSTNNAAADSTTIVQLADPAVTMTHAGHFTRGQQGTYTVTISNLGSAPTTGSVTVTDTLPAGLTPAAISGAGWTCTLVPLSCTRADSIAQGESYPPITVTVNVATDAGTPLMHTVTVAALSDVNPANNTATDLTVVLVVPSLTWDTPAPITYGTALSATQLNASAAVPGAFAYSPGLNTVLPAGPHTLNVTFTPDDPNTFAPVTASVNLTVSKATSVIGWTDPAPIPYGTVLSATQLNAAAGVAGTFVYSPPAGTILTAGSHTLTVTFTPADTANYNIATASVTQVVSKLTPVITWADPVPIVYGTALSATQLNASTTVAGAFVYSPGAGTVLAFGSHNLNVTFTPTDTANYNAATASVTQVVSKETAVITWANPAPIVYGTALSAMQLNASTTVAGTLTYSPAAGTVLTVGSHALNVTFTPTDTANYNGATASVTQVVSKSTPVITWAPPAPIGYGTALSTTQLNASTTVAGTFVYSPTAGTVLPAGSQTMNVTFTPTDTTNYNNATGSVTLVVNQQTPVITWATPAAITYGAPLSAAQLNATANVAGTFLFSPVAGTVPGAGINTLSVTFTPTDSVNYSAATASVALTVNKAAPVITWATPSAIVYGTPLGAAQFSATANVPGTFAYAPSAGAVLPAGGQTLNVTFTPADSGNYNTVTASVTQLVNRATPTITWPNPAPISPGTALSAAQLNATAAVAGTFVYTPAAGTMLPAGIHTLNVTFTPADPANHNNAAASVTVVVRENAQSIYFPPIADRWYRDTPVLLAATASSGLPVSYAVVSGPARVSGSMLTVTGPGRISVRASQPGGGAWEAAEDVEQSFVAGYRTEVRAVPGLTVRIDDAGVAGGSAFIWEPGTSHRIEVLPFQAIMPGRGYRFATWSDGGAREHIITAAAADAIYTANFVLQFQLIVDVRPDPAAGTVVPGTGFFDAGTTVALEARPNAGYSFVGYSGDAAGPNLAMTEPRSVTATFAAGPKLEAVTQAASFLPGPLTSGGLFTVWGSGLGGSTLAITDSAGVERMATVMYTSATQVNFLTPAGLANGPAVLRHTGEDGRQATLAVEVAAVVPGLFSANMDGRGAPAGQVLRLNASGEEMFSGALARCAAGSGCDCEPIDLGAPDDQVFVILYGTGFRNYTSMRATIGGVEVDVTWAGAQPTFAGLDQINLRLPRVLAGRGELEVALTIDGKTTNLLDLEMR
ncbi:MAG TPA: hypothetical protein VN428_23175 [Bryobacteraceae bacterium]|nr:hypothetical protein [Bryobacteraceae bacterium]